MATVAHHREPVTRRVMHVLSTYTWTEAYIAIVLLLVALVS